MPENNLQKMYMQPLFLSDSSSEDSESPKTKAESKLMRKAMKGLFESEFGKDFDIVVGDSRIKVHKLILMREGFLHLTYSDTST